MSVIRIIIKGIEWVSEWSGRIASFFVIVMTLTVCYEVLMRYIFNHPTLWYSDLNYMLGGSLMAIGLAAVFKRDGHIRIDILLTRLPERTKLIIDIFFTLVVFIPSFVFLSRAYWSDAFNAFKIKETIMTSTWYPPAWPFRAALATGFSLFLLQGIAKFIKDTFRLVTGSKLA